MNIEQKLTSMEVAEMVEKMHQELVLIRKELQAMNSKEPNNKVKYVRKNGRIIRKHMEPNERYNPNTTLGRTT